MVAPGVSTGQGIGDNSPVGYHPLHPDVSLKFQMVTFTGWFCKDADCTDRTAGEACVTV